MYNPRVRGKWAVRLLRFVFPTGALGLGFWQLQRLREKKTLIQNINDAMKKEPIKATTASELFSSPMNRRLCLQGQVDYQLKPILVGPRGSRDIGYDYSYEIIVPFILSGDGTRILVNMGRVPIKCNLKPRLDFNEIIVLHEQGEKKSAVLPANNPELGRWNFKDFEAISEKLNTKRRLTFKRICDNELENLTVPIASPPAINLSNRHLEYVITWFGIALSSAAMSFLL